MENYIENMDAVQKYDTILCLSMTKWIHINFGDLGIKRLFKKMCSNLNPGGYLILEPQEWRSYKKNKRFSKEFAETIE